MLQRLFLALSLAASLTAAEGPWTDTWTMPLRGAERTYVEYAGRSWLEVSAQDLADTAFVQGKEILLLAQFDRLEDGWLHLIELAPLRVSGGTWDGLRYGDYLYVLAEVAASAPLNLRVSHVLRAPSDQSRLAERIAAVADTDFPARIALADTLRSEAATRANRDLWEQTASNLYRETIRAAAQQAKESKDGALMRTVLGWAIGVLGDQSLGAQLAQEPWLRELSAAQTLEIERYLHSQGLIRRDGTWVAQSMAIREAYEQRLQQIDGTSADAWLKLAEWIDSYGDVLPQAQELRHRALQRGLQVDSEHPGIRAALGLAMPMRHSDASTAWLSGPLVIPGPAGWKRHSTPVSGLASWGPSDESAYLSLQLLTGETLPSEDAAWEAERVHNAELREGWEKLSSPPVPGWSVLSGTYMDGSAKRLWWTAWQRSEQGGLQFESSVLLGDTLSPESYLAAMAAYLSGVPAPIP